MFLNEKTYNINTNNMKTYNMITSRGMIRYSTI